MMNCRANIGRMVPLSSMRRTAKSWSDFMRNALNVLTALAALLILPEATLAQSWPTQPIKLVVPYAAGGVLDVLARLAAEHIKAKTGQVVVLEHRPGAAGNTALGQLAKTKPDGHTLGAAVVSNFVVNPHIYKKMPLDPMKDLIPVAPFALAPQLLVVPTPLPVKSLQELVTYARKNNVNYGSAGTGTPNHISTLYVLNALGMRATHIPYRGAAPAVTDMLTGNLQMMVVAPFALSGQIEAGRLRPLAAVSDKRLPGYPSVPTMAEQGFPNYDLGIWYGLVAPAGTPGPIVDQLNRLVVSMADDPEIGKKFNELNMQSMPVTPAAFAAQIRADAPKWEAIIKQAGIQPE
jgi:tripartite-type tricarboxylate transporter receptor subunit TctC